MTKRMAIMGLVGSIMVGGLAGCTSTGANTSKDYGTEVVGRINNRDIIRSEVLDGLLEKQVVTAYINDELKKEFLKDAKVSKEEIDAQIEVYKMMIQGDWDEYIKDQMGGSEELLRERIELELKESKMLAEVQENMEITDEEIETEYANNGDRYKVAGGNVLYTLTDDADMIARIGYEAGKSMKEIMADLDDAEAVYEFKERENLLFTYDGFESPLSAYNVGDLVMTVEQRYEGDSTFIFEILKKSDGLEDLRVSIEEAIKETKGFEQLNSEFAKYIESSTVEVLGEKLFEAAEQGNKEVETIEEIEAIEEAEKALEDMEKEQEEVEIKEGD